MRRTFSSRGKAHSWIAGRSARALRACAVAIAVSCIGLAAGGRSAAITGGTEISAAEYSASYPWTAFVKTTGGTCTGTLVHASWILTAAHCLAGGASISDVRMGSNDRTTALSVPIDDVQIHPSYDGDPTHGSDYLMLHLTTPASAASLPIASVRPAAGSVGEIAGWGGGTTLRRATRQTGSFAPKLIALSAGDGSAEAGDSGGPFVVATPTGPALAGVLSFIDGAGTDYAGDIQLAKSWIQALTGAPPSSTQIAIGLLPGYEIATESTEDQSFSAIFQIFSTKNVTLEYTPRPITASDADFDAATHPVTVAANEIKSVPISISSDAIDEPDETFAVDITSAPAGAVVEGEVTFTIAQPPLASIGNISVTEGSSGDVVTNVPLTLTKPWHSDITVGIDALPGSASGADFRFFIPGSEEEQIDNQVVIPPGDTSATIPVTIVGDDLDEPDEDFTLGISYAYNAQRSHAPGAVTIIDDDEPGFTFEGFDAPVDNAPVLNVANAGRVIPLKFRLTTADGSPASDPASVDGITSTKVSCEASQDGGTDTLEAYATGSGLQYNGDGIWQFNWATSKSFGTSGGPCRTLTLTLADGTTHAANFRFK